MTDQHEFFLPEGQPAPSRREFIKSVIASGVVVSSVAYVPTTWAQSTPGKSGAVERLLSLNVNGQTRRVDVLPNETLAMTLRYKLGLTGTKLGCDRAECGACTVIVDGVTHYSCSTLTHRVRGRQITTVEGLEGASGELHPVQQAFMDELGPRSAGSARRGRSCRPWRCSRSIQTPRGRKHARRWRGICVGAELTTTI